ncbi:MAG TPA: hypothetical protein EYN79_09940 [Planctomycetes bacterium]|nr:hypothetical protein [Planctomycetota bacterium]HIN79672.1 hypothetical protein [Planctomycetota bacterium]
MRLLVILLVGIFGLSSSGGAQDPDYVFYFDTPSGPNGSIVTVRCLLDNNGLSLNAWSYGVCHDVAAAEILVAEPGSAPLTANGGQPAGFLSIETYPGVGMNQGVVIDLFGVNLLPPGLGHECALVDYLLIGPDDTVAALAYCDTVGSPPVELVIVPASGIALVPTTLPGEIEIGGVLPFTLAATGGTTVLQGDPAEATVTLSCPTEAYGFSFGLGHDPLAFHLDSAEIGDALAVLNGGAGPDFIALVTEPSNGDGLIMAVVISLGPVLETLPIGDDQEIALAHYSTQPTAPIGASSLDFTGSLAPPTPSPPTPIVVSTGEEGAPVNTSGTTFTIEEQPLGTFFIRGDIDGNGVHDLSDPVKILNYLFLAGPQPECMKSADCNDNGSVDLADPVYLLDWLYTAGPALPDPLDECGLDPTEDTLICDTYPGC